MTHNNPSSSYSSHRQGSSSRNTPAARAHPIIPHAHTHAGPRHNGDAMPVVATRGTVLQQERHPPFLSKGFSEHGSYGSSAAASQLKLLTDGGAHLAL